jgi:small subunit ribosomal protein S2
MDEEEEETRAEPTLVPLEKYLESGVHIGSRFRSGQMNKFIYKCRPDGLCVLDITTLNQRIRIASKMIARYDASKVLIVAGRAYAQRPAQKLAEMIGATYIVGRFIPGVMTNPSNEKFIEPGLIFTADPPVDRQAIKESVVAKIPVISLCDTSNLLKNIDLVIPANNKGKKALALIFWLLAREILRERGTIKPDGRFDVPIDEFESKAEIERDSTKPDERRPFGRFRRAGPMRGGDRRGGRR